MLMRVSLIFVSIWVLAACASGPQPDPAAHGTESVDPGLRRFVTETAIDFKLPEPFVRLVDLDRLRVGMTRAEVLGHFPDPDAIELRHGDELWQYGFAELIFRDGRPRDWFDL